MLCQLKEDCVKLAKDHRQNRPQPAKKASISQAQGPAQGSSNRNENVATRARKESQEESLVRQARKESQEQPIHMRVIQAPPDDDLDKASTESLQGSVAPSEDEDITPTIPKESSSTQEQKPEDLINVTEPEPLPVIKEEKINQDAADLTTQEDSGAVLTEQEAKAIADDAAEDLDKASTESIQGSNAPSEP